MKLTTISPILLILASATLAHAQEWHYDYDNRIAIYGIATSGTVHEGKTLVAEAKAKLLDDGRIEVEETHFSPDGAVVYKGRIWFRGAGEKVAEETVSGKRPKEQFKHWAVNPSGGPRM
jgi:hypothetical protein